MVKNLHTCYYPFMKNLDMKDVIKKLNLVPLQPEGGYFSQTWKTEDGTAIYYLVTPESWSGLHLLSITEIWHFYCGEPLIQLQLYPDGRAECVKMGADLLEGQVPQVICPDGVWQATRLAPGCRWALTGTTMAPPYTDECIRFPEDGELERLFPQHKELIKEFV